MARTHPLSCRMLEAEGRDMAICSGNVLMDKDGMSISQRPEVGLLEGAQTGLVEGGSTQETHMGVQQVKELESRKGSLSLVISWPARGDIAHFRGTTAGTRHRKWQNPCQDPQKCSLKK